MLWGENGPGRPVFRHQSSPKQFYEKILNKFKEAMFKYVKTTLPAWIHLSKQNYESVPIPGPDSGSLGKQLNNLELYHHRSGSAVRILLKRTQTTLGSQSLGTQESFKEFRNVGTLHGSGSRVPILLKQI